MAYETPTTLQLQDRAVAGQAAEFPNLNTQPGSEARQDSLARARLSADNSQQIAALERNIIPSTSDENGLEQWSGALDVPRGPATKVRGLQALECNGNAGGTVSIGLQLIHQSTLLYQTISGGVIGASGILTVDIESIDTGFQTRLNAGEPLTFLSPPANVNAGARVIKSLVDGGADEEPLGQWAERQELVWQKKRINGSEAGYTIVVLAEPEIVQVFLYRRKPTAGSLSVAGFKIGEGTSKVLDPTERSNLESVLQAEMVNDTVIVLETVTRKIHVDVVVDLLPDVARDFADAMIVDSWDAGTSTVTTTAAIPADVGAGDLLTIESALPDATGATGKAAIVSAVTGPTTMTLAPVDGIQPVLDFVPVNADVIYPGSLDLHQAWQAIRFGAASCGTIPGLEQLGPANPGRIHGSWLADIRASDIKALALSVEAIIDATVVLSTAPNVEEIAVEFAFPDDDQVELLLPGQVVIR